MLISASYQIPRSIIHLVRRLYCRVKPCMDGQMSSRTGDIIERIMCISHTPPLCPLILWSCLLFLMQFAASHVICLSTCIIGNASRLSPPPSTFVSRLPLVRLAVIMEALNFNQLAESENIFNDPRPRVVRTIDAEKRPHQSVLALTLRRSMNRANRCSWVRLKANPIGAGS